MWPINNSRMTYTRTYTEQEPARVEIDARAGHTLLEFGAPWCGHCIAAQTAIEDAMSAHGELVHFKIEDGRGKPLGRSFRVKLWPTLVVMQDGVEVARVVRPVAAEQVERLLASF